MANRILIDTNVLLDYLLTKVIVWLSALFAPETVGCKLDARKKLYDMVW